MVISENKTLLSISKSWCYQNSDVNSTDDLLSWVAQRNAEATVEIKRIDLALLVHPGFMLPLRVVSAIRTTAFSL